MLWSFGVAANTVMASLVACNVYISAGRRNHADLLLKILSNAQKQCRLLRAASASEKMAVVHAYADSTYDRSSIHLAGEATPVVAVTSDIVTNTIQSLLVESNRSTEKETVSSSSRHPFVGIVDHVSVMPLASTVGSNDEGNEDWYTSPSANAARDIGQSMEKLGVNVYYYGHAHPQNVNVYYYGHAHPQNVPLAQVRRQFTSFFQSGGMNESSSTGTTKTSTTINLEPSAGTCTVGTPPAFVENYNVRIQSDIKTARSLTKLLRERDGGLKGVEALTLPYGDGRYEVACNLLCPNVGSVDAIDAMVKEWSQRDENEHVVVVEKAYRVGTTVELSGEAIQAPESVESALKYDRLVMQRFKEYLN